MRTRIAFPPRLRAICALAGAAVLAACAGVQPQPMPIAHAAADQPAPAPAPQYLTGPFDRVPVEGRAILVNIPSYELIAFEDGKEVFRSRVIVGTAKDPTPEMVATTSVVRFRPTWTPTPDMVREEGLSPRTRPPGPKNPLGLLAVRLDPGLLIYLHGTNNPDLFDREVRALSHGCIRVEKWDEAAAFVLDVPVDEVLRHANGRRTFDMQTDGVPVIVRYETLFPDETGLTDVHPDVYGRGTHYVSRPRAISPRADTRFRWTEDGDIQSAL